VKVLAFIGFGELGAALAERLGGAGSGEMRAWTRERSDPAAEQALATRLRDAGVARRPSLRDAVEGAGIVLSAVPGSASREIAEQVAGLLDPDTLFVDLTAAPIADKEAGAEAIAKAGGLYADAAVLGAVAAPGALRIVASGPGAGPWVQTARSEGLELELETLDGPAGLATRLKLLRSVYMKGRDALIVETLVAARRCGLEERLAASIDVPGERVPFPELADRVLRSLAIHAGRRAAELNGAGDAVAATGVEPLLSRAGAETLRRVAELGLREELGGERPESGAEVLALLDERLG